MKLRDHITQEGLTLAEFAKRINRSEATVSRIARGINTPDWATMLSIIEATAGAVQPNDFLADEAAA